MSAVGLSLSLGWAVVASTVKAGFIEAGLYAFALGFIVLAVLAYLYMPRWPFVSRLRAPAIVGCLLVSYSLIVWESAFRYRGSFDATARLRIEVAQAKQIVAQKNVQALAAAQEYIAQADRVAEIESERDSMQGAIDNFVRKEAEHDAKDSSPRACFDFDAFSRSLRLIDAGSRPER